MFGLSLVIMVNNDLDAATRILTDMLDVCDELIVIDIGSNDDTLRAAEALGAKFYSFHWNGCDADARNFARTKCDGQWIIYLDPYDQINETGRVALKAMFGVLLQRSDVDVVNAMVHSEFYSQQPSGFRYASYHPVMCRNDESLQWEGIATAEIDVAPERQLFTEDFVVESRPTEEKLHERSEGRFAALESAVNSGAEDGRTLMQYAIELAARERFLLADEYFERANVATLREDERYELYLAMASCSQQLGEPNEQLSSLGKALALDTRRAEAFIQLGDRHFRRAEWDRAISFFRAASVLRRPTKTFGHFDEAAYSWLSWDYLSVCASELGKLDDALDYTFKALPANPQRDRLMANIRLIVQRKKELADRANAGA